MSCKATNVRGEPCGALVVDADGLCAAHREPDRMRETSAKGGRATQAKYATEGFRADELPALTDHESVKSSIEVALRAHAERRITHHELTSHTKGCEVWLKVDSAQQTKQLVTELQHELERAKRECEALRRQLAGGTAPRLRRA